MQLNPYLFFDGNCAAAFKFYEKCLNGKIAGMMTHAESPMKDQTPPESRDRIMHARLLVGDEVLMGSDGQAGRYKTPQGFSVAVGVKDPAEAERVFNALAENGAVTMPLQ